MGRESNFQPLFTKDYGSKRHGLKERNCCNQLNQFIQFSAQLKSDCADLDKKESQIDEHIRWLKQSIKNITEDPQNMSHSFLTQNDLRSVFPQKTLFTLHAAPGTSVEVMHPKSGPDPRYSLRMKSSVGPGTVCLITAEEPRNFSRNEQQNFDDPGQILEGEEEENDGEQKKKDEFEDSIQRLSPPPSEKDYFLNVNSNESLFDLYNDQDNEF